MSRDSDKKLNIESYSEADIHYNFGRFRSALRCFKISALADPEDGDAQLGIGNCWDAMKKPANAETAFRKALELLPEARRPDALFNLGNALLDQGNFQEAVSVYSSIPKGTVVAEKAARNMEIAVAGMRAN
jgi:tetratricopeptide (TPR) repeat protein